MVVDIFIGKVEPVPKATPDILYQVFAPAIIGLYANWLIVYEVAGVFGMNSQASLVAVHGKGQFLGSSNTGSFTISKLVDVASTNP